MSGLPPSLKSIGHYLKIANEHSGRDPVIYYWCLVYAVESAMKIDKKSPDCMAYLSGLLGTLEQVKDTLKGEEAIRNELVAQAHIEQYALNLFAQADTDDRNSIFNKNVVKKFYTSGHLFDTLETFGELDEQIAKNRKYAKWKAAHIHNCLRTGVQPEPGPMRAEGEASDEEGAEEPPPPIGFPNDAPADAPPVLLPPPPQPQTLAAPAAALSADGVSPAALASAQKLCRYAISALEYEDVRTAVANLTDALALLQPSSTL